MEHRISIILALLGGLCCSESLAQEPTFSKGTFSDGITTLQYRKATIAGSDDGASLVIYLHGGSSKGDDNEAQMQEPGINATSAWLLKNKRKAIMLVPQCPQDKSWLGTMQDALVHLLQTYTDRGVADAGKVYILGGSMGGTGTWNMLSHHPELFAAAMPVAGNPTGLSAEAVAQTPVYIVMGTADNLMKISNVETFLKDMDNYQPEYRFDIEQGWTHEDVCKNSYTEERLDWVFQHTRESSMGISVPASAECETANVVWFSLDGQQLPSEPVQRGVYIKKSFYADGSTTARKCCIY